MGLLARLAMSLAVRLAARLAAMKLSMRLAGPTLLQRLAVSLAMRFLDGAADLLFAVRLLAMRLALDSPNLRQLLMGLSAMRLLAMRGLLARPAHLAPRSGSRLFAGLPLHRGSLRLAMPLTGPTCC